MAGTAWAKVRSGSGVDPREANLPASRDIERVSASYDDKTGKFLVSVRLYEAATSAATLEELVSLTAEFGPQGAGSCVPVRPNLALFLSDTDPTRTSVAISSPRLKQPVAGKKTVSADRRQIQLSISRPDLAGLDLRCAQVTTRLAGQTTFDQLDTPIFFPGPFPATPTACVVPKVVGRTLAQAKVAASGASCALGTVRRARSRKLPVGRIISQRPPAGTELAIGSKISVVVSRGKR